MANTATNTVGFTAPAGNAPYWSTYYHIPTKKNYRQISEGNGSDWVEIGISGTGTGGGGGGTGSGIYGGSGTAPSNTVATLTDNLTFDGKTIFDSTNGVEPPPLYEENFLSAGVYVFDAYIIGRSLESCI